MAGVQYVLGGGASSSHCSPSFIPQPSLFGAEIINLSTNLITNYSQEVPAQYNFNDGSLNVSNIDFCNITVTYTHPGQNNTINVEAWLPLHNYNGRMQAVGGGGYIAGRWLLSQFQMSAAVGEGYATITTDAGLGTETNPNNWGQVSPGNVNLYLLQNLASVSVNDQAIIGKSFINSFYGEPPKYSYFSGCSQGGRQGLMLAQRYPDAYDGIAASAPAIDWGEVLMAMYWPQMLMNIHKVYPHGCELDEITAAAARRCDGDDDVVDGIISDPDSCHFDPFSVVGQRFNCSGVMMDVSKGAAFIANATWAGPWSSKGKSLYPGVHIGSDLSGNGPMGQALATTVCFDNGTCAGKPHELVTWWISLFVLKDPEYDCSTMTHEEFDRLFRLSVQEYRHMGTNEPDMTEFFERGGRILGYHGLSDQILPARGGMRYYDDVARVSPDVHDHYRVFQVPGMAHCWEGDGGQPLTVFDALRDWVENGTVPDTLPISFTDKKGTKNDRIICPYPQRVIYDGRGSPTSFESFSCS
ncbi:hypothetical protein ONS95_001902 [Cadophora gregata]|uniref:uncharacterized protein n=2 Tax=Cadophora gregata TaxID=51156 RepID=UPI0026DCCDF1|nr:uncharacterized protein ONS95_001902 [Cadophora gregata]KAK0111550.1 hypothetical protein ONS95_001902 [Cadophora gregata]KAK0111975.1 hypothetical protein ONS96_001237 [Cadophora gregata f. sp. sojae]